MKCSRLVDKISDCKKPEGLVQSVPTREVPGGHIGVCVFFLTAKGSHQWVFSRGECDQRSRLGEVRVWCGRAPTIGAPEKGVQERSEGTWRRQG